MHAFWEGVLAGYGIAIPVGAIAVLIIDTGLRRGFALGFMAGSGAAVADLVYAAVAAVAGEALSLLLVPYATALRIASALLLFALGLRGLLRTRVATQREVVDQSIGSADRFATFARFLGLTLLNPLTVAYFAALILGRESEIAGGIANRIKFVAGAGLASWSWQTLLACTGALAGQRMSPRLQKATTIAGNLIVLGFGLRIAKDLLSN